MIENIARGSDNFIAVDGEVWIFRYQNEEDEMKEITRSIHKEYIQFHFGLKGTTEFLFNGGGYRLQMPEEKMLLLYNPKKDLPLHLQIAPKSSVVSILISIQKFHSLFSSEANHIDFLSIENKDKKYYTDAVITTPMIVVLHQIINANMHPNVQSLYLKGKVYELLGLFFNQPEEADVEQCPFLSDEENVLKIRKAKEIIINRMAEPPSLQDLANEVGLNLKKLKTGFKQIYGDSVYSFLFDYKMEIARKMLEDGECNVNEVSGKIGYSNPSHFISAFKKKFGTTPKKYLTAQGN